MAGERHQLVLGQAHLRTKGQKGFPQPMVREPPKARLIANFAEPIAEAGGGEGLSLVRD